jgi:L-alanine-DL-glutamate epimerase-like enolase superfamily enzyme
MKVKSVVVRILEAEVPGGFRNARRAWSRKSFCFAFVEAEGGRIGVGEGWTSYGSARALAATIEEEVVPLILGQPVWSMGRLVESCRRSVEMSGRSGIMSAACAAIEMALWDLWAKELCQPLAHLWGTARDRIPVYASAGLYAAGKGYDALGAEMAGYVAQGFTAVKLKVGGAPMEEDVRRVAAVREAVGPAVTLMVDAHYTLDAPAALKFAKAIETYDIAWFEAPIQPGDLAGYADLAKRSPIPLSGNETLPLVADFARLIEARGVSYVMFDLSVCGGFIEGRRIATLAHQASLPITLHSSSSIVLMLGNLHFAASVPNLHSCEFHMMHRWLFDRLERPLTVENGSVELPSDPGVGISLTPDDGLFAQRQTAPS